MMNKDTEIGNKLIADFMEYSFNDAIIPYDHYDKNGTMEWETRYRKPTVDDLQYHTSWDWRQPVIEKIVSLGYNVEQVNSPGYSCCRIYANKDVPSCGAIVKDTAFEAITAFITWYNLQPQQLGNL